MTVLQEIALDPGAAGAARTQAARSVLEAQGRLGRHAPPPATVSLLPLSTASRDELEAELARVQRRIAEQDAYESLGLEPVPG